MSGLFQFSVGTTASGFEVSGPSATPPGNDKVLLNLLTGIRLRHKKSRWGNLAFTHTFTSVMSDNSNGVDHNTQYLVEQPRNGLFLKAAFLHVGECFDVSSTTIQPVMTVSMYKNPLATNYFGVDDVVGNKVMWKADHRAVHLIPPTEVRCNDATDDSDGGGITDGIVALPIEQQYIAANEIWIFEVVPPAVSSSVVYGWKKADLLLQFAELHTT